MKPPCMIVVQDILPMLRVEITHQLIEVHGMKKTETARRMGITQAAVSQYLSQARGNNPEDLIRKSKTVMGLVDELASDIAAGKSSFDLLIMKMCRVCSAVRSEGLLCEIHKNAVPGLRTISGCSCSLGIRA